MLMGLLRIQCSLDISFGLLLEYITSFNEASSGWWGPLLSAGPLARGDPGFGSMLARLKFDQASISLLELDLLTRTLTRLV